MPWHRQFLILLHRCCKEQFRKRNVFFTQVAQSIVMALLIGGVFFQIGTSQASTIKRQPVLFFCVVNQGVLGALKVVNSFPGERAVMLRERAVGMYYCSAYFMAKVCSLLKIMPSTSPWRHISKLDVLFHFFQSAHFSLKKKHVINIRWLANPNLGHNSFAPLSAPLLKWRFSSFSNGHIGYVGYLSWWGTYIWEVCDWMWSKNGHQK